MRLGAAAAGIRYQGRTDLVMIELAAGTTVAGVFTSSKCPGAPVDWCRASLAGGKARGVVVNAGNANVFTGKAGRDACAATAAAAAKLVGCPAKQVFIASTGVIGEVLPHEKLIAALPALHAGLRDDGWEAAARGIMTTDTFPKAATRTARIGEAEVRISGIAKGSGMIAPDMATMLCFVFTDAKLPAGAMQALLKKGVDASFNCTTVDSDTSTSDTVLLFATGQAKHPRVPAEGGSMLADFARALDAVLLDLALQVVRDGEGAQKLVRIDVSGATTARSAKRIGLAVANSPLVKTAIAGEDANWGRIVMAVGKAGEPADRDKLSVGVGGVWMARNGGVVPDYDEGPVTQHMKGREVAIAIDLGLGRGKATRLDLRSDARLHRYQRVVSELTARLGTGGDQAFEGISDAAKTAASANQRLHHDLAGRAPEDPAPELTVVAVEGDDLFVFLAFHAMVQFDNHLNIVEVGPPLQQHEIGDLEGKSGGQIRADPGHFHRDPISDSQQRPVRGSRSCEQIPHDTVNASLVIETLTIVRLERFRSEMSM